LASSRLRHSVTLTHKASEARQALAAVARTRLTTQKQRGSDSRCCTVAFNVSRTAHTALHFESIGCSDQEESNQQEESCRFQGHTPFDEAVSDSPLRSDSGTASWLSPISTQEILNRTHAAMNRFDSSVIEGKIESTSVSPIPPTTTHHHCFAQCEPASLPTYLPLLQ
jgi:hypothetical protein